MSNCSCHIACFDGCPFELNSDCVIYTGTVLDEINVPSGSTLTEVLIAIDALDLTKQVFIPTTNNTIQSIVGGILGHSPTYNVKVNPSTSNAISSSSAGLFAGSSEVGDGKVKVDSSDTKDYLESQLAEGSDDDNILTVTPTKVGGVIRLVPSINVSNLLTSIQTNHLDLFCFYFSTCAPKRVAQ